MKIQDHLEKSERIERSGRKLNPDADYEMFVETYMLAGTHVLNAVLHGMGITPEKDDLLHSDKPPLNVPVPPEISEMMKKLKQIEDMRNGYLRGNVIWQAGHGDLCVDNMRFLRATARQLLP